MQEDGGLSEIELPDSTRKGMYQHDKELIRKSPSLSFRKEQAEKWEKKEDLLGKCISTREGMTPFIFYEGPPTANGKPGIHHVIARTLKGLRVPLQDHAGL